MKKVLIIDDDAGIIDVITIILESDGYDVRSVDDDSKVFETIEEFEPDLILLDIWMPGMGGKEICKRIKNNDRYRNIKTIMVSASVDIEKVADDCGADGCLEKPFEMDGLLATVKGYIEETR